MTARVCSFARWALLVLLAVYFVFLWGQWEPRTGIEAFDIYQYFYPNMLYAARSAAEGGRGFFWNPLQMCGQPFFGISSTATLYPPHLLFLVLDPDVALRAVVIINFIIGGVGAYFLCRELGLGELAATCGAMSFELGNAAVDLSTWTPQVSPAYLWMPIVMLCCERVLRGPSVGRAIALGLALTAPWLVGSPQLMLFTCQLIALRLLWEILTRPGPRPFLALPALSFGVAFPFLLAAVQLWPGLEVARDSVRGLGLTMQDILGVKPADWSDFVVQFSQRHNGFNPFVFVPTGLASAALLGGRTWRHVAFYATVGGLYFTLSLGPATSVFDLYTELPFGTVFREPLRFMLVASFSMAVLTACGVEALVGPRPDAELRSVRYAKLAAVIAAFVGLWALSAKGLRAGEWVLLGIVLAACVVAVQWPARRNVAGLVMAVAIGFNLVGFIPWWQTRSAEPWYLRSIGWRRLLPDGAALRRHAAAFEAARSRMTAQDRAYLVHPHPSAAFGPKSAALFDIPVVQDYEPQPSRRIAEYVVLMRSGREMSSLRDYYYLKHGPLTRSFRRRLLDLTGARYLLVDRTVDTSPSPLDPPPRLAEAIGGVHLYVNDSALPRARFVPRVEVVADPRLLLQRLARGPLDLRRIALIEEPLPSRFAGTPSASGEVEFVRDDPEHVVLHVRATERGFLLLADQYAPGWLAHVNGVPVAIARANYAFRLVEVPAGESTIGFDYAPRSIRLGAIVSALTAATLVAFALHTWRSRAGKER